MSGRATMRPCRGDVNNFFRCVATSTSCLYSSSYKHTGRGRTAFCRHPGSFYAKKSRSPLPPSRRARIWCHHEASNPGPSPYKGAALPSELWWRFGRCAATCCYWRSYCAGGLSASGIASSSDAASGGCSSPQGSWGRSPNAAGGTSCARTRYTDRLRSMVAMRTS